MKKNKNEIPTNIKLLLEFTPLILFFIAYKKSTWLINNITIFKTLDPNLHALIPATAVIIIATLITNFIYWLYTRKLQPVTIFSMVLIIIFGGLTIIFADDNFIKIKVTVIYVIFSAILFIGLAFKKNMLAYLFNDNLKLTETGWNKLTLRWAIFFLILAVLNEFARIYFSTEIWTYLKVFGFLGLTILFMMMQIPLIKKHLITNN
ncbi:inner membrane-spanning protein YciB [Bartonella sp. DGB1]|uniref:inner membrane-spanning protein YciB n=1 Tax=Bartonella sp. DGB1 TaxID=3239807 RepID=UPI003523C063